MKLIYFQYHSIVHENIIRDIKQNITNSDLEVIFFGYTEWEIPAITKELINDLRLLNVKFTIVHGAARNNHYEVHYKNLGVDIDSEVRFWDTYWFNYSYNCLKTFLIRGNIRNFKHKFISLNNRSHIHRCALMEELAKENLLDKGVVSWIKHLNENPNYPFKHFDNKQRLIGDNFEKLLDSYLIPNEFFESAFHIVTEATPHVLCISEKTAKVIFFKRPFIVLGAKGFNKHLATLGFKLYDEIIDYSFDDQDDLLERTRLFVQNIHKILQYDPNQLYHMLYPKAEFNYKRAIEITKTSSLVPDVCFDDKRLVNEILTEL